MRWPCCGLILLMIGLVGCSGQAHPLAFSGRIPVTEIFSASQSRMSGSQPSAVWCRRIEQVEKYDPFLVEKLHAAYPDKLPWDGAHEGVLLIYMGRQPTGGYRLVLVEPDAQVRQGVAVVQVDWQRPEVGAIVTQVISSPCLVVKMPVDGLQLIKILDRDGTQRTEAAVRE